MLAEPAIKKLSRRERVAIRIQLIRYRFLASWSIYREDRLAVFGLLLIGMFALMAVAHPILMATIWERRLFDPTTGFDSALIPHPSSPGGVHLLGTDALGRDVLSMILAATTPTFIIGLTAAITTAVMSIIASIPAAYYRGRVDTVLASVMDVVVLLPAPILMIIVGARWPDLYPIQLGFIYGLATGLGSAAIVMRTAALKVSAKPFMEAAHVSGANPFQVMTKHFLPNMLPLAVLQMMIAVSGAVIADGFISFFGLRRVTANWGTLVYDAYLYANIAGDFIQWHLLIPAAMCFSFFALAFYLVSRGMHRVADPRLRDEH
jgi:ABC-type dipeptide/oligopeptide/nickel transport system permease subunit